MGNAPRANGKRRSRYMPVRIGLVLLLVALVVVIGVNLWLQHQPPSADANVVHADILAGRSGAEVTFTGNVVGDPTDSNGHERILVRDQVGDTLELDYNLSLGRRVPVHSGDSIVVHGQLYIDPTKVGVHCLHARTSRGCPEQGWVQFAGTTYS